MTPTCAGCGTTSDTDTPPEGWIEHYGVYGCDACRVGFRGDRPSVLGLDISSVRLDACLLVPGEPPVLRHEIIGKSSEPLIERVRRVPAAITELCVVWHGATWGYPEWVVIEDPGSMRFKNMTSALLPVLGAITCSVPTATQVAWRKASEWRHDLGCANTKEAGHEAVIDILLACGWLAISDLSKYDEHELDAIGIALGWARILEENARIPGKKECRSDAQTSSGVTAPNRAEHV